MVEVQLNQALYDALKSYAGYHSDVTRVCAFRDSLVPLLLEHGVPLEHDCRMRVGVDRKATISVVQGKVMKVDHAEPDMLLFLGCGSEMDPTVSIFDIQQVKILLDAGLLIPNTDFLELYGPMTMSGHVGELVCSGVRVRGTGRLVDFLNKSATLQSLNILDAKVKPVNILTVHGEVQPLPGGDGHVNGDRYVSATVKAENGIRVEARFFSRSPLLLSELRPGNRITLGVTKVVERMEKTGDGREQEVWYVSDPMFLPRGLRLECMDFLSPSRRGVPAALWRCAVHEALLRVKGLQIDGMINDANEQKWREGGK